jgi:hypothetical protein
MGFKDRLAQEQEAQAASAQAHAEAAARARDTKLGAARKAAEAMLTELYEAVDALREHKERSEQQLMKYPDHARYSGNVGAIMATVKEETPSKHWWLKPVVQHRQVLDGWWFRYRSTENAPFEFEVPLTGPPSVGRYDSAGRSAGKKWTFEDFATGGLYEFQRGGEELGPIETKEIGADQVFRDFLSTVKEHLLHLPQLNR